MNLLTPNDSIEFLAGQDPGRRLTVSPKRGETFKLVDALRPTTLVLETAKALNLMYPPVLLTYKGQVSNVLVRQEYHL